MTAPLVGEPPCARGWGLRCPLAEPVGASGVAVRWDVGPREGQAPGSPATAERTSRAEGVH